MEHFDENGKVICQICGKSYEILSNHLTKHNMSGIEYKEKYPGCPIASEKFRAKMKFSKSDIFNNKKDVVEEIIVNEEPEIEEFDEVKILEKSNSKLNVIDQTKEEILDLLLTYFPHVKKDFLITKLTHDKRIEYEFITDFCDPILKIVIDFPKVFWHNNDRYMNYNRDNMLEQDGWKVIKINSTSFHDIQKALS